MDLARVQYAFGDKLYLFKSRKAAEKRRLIFAHGGYL